MKILITGANGFVGTNLAQKFIIGGHSVRCLVHKNLSELKNLPVEIRHGSITDSVTLVDAVKGVDFVFHCAGVLRAKDTKTFYDINQTGTKNLIETVHKYNPSIKRFIYISSQAAMGPCINLTNPKDPDSICEPVSDYGRSKMLGENEVLKFKDKLPVTILRPAAIYGPYDKDIFTFFQMASKGFFPILTGRKKCFVQLLFINDLVEICSLILTNNGLKRNTYFLAEKQHYSWQEIGKIISAAIGKKIFIFTLPGWLVKFAALLSEASMKVIKNEPSAFNMDKVKEFCQKYWLGDSSKTEQEFKFTFTSLENGAKITYNWYVENKWLR
ncbi:MAG: hypothetical protein A3J83_06200 [Elusimicrobia bacterium RIFOXYA2_FULL_40_6]|nr:MAG: hypothetical protein A3J83_06200 [Elusimicrobia bacterium RIFOXYA2_FULL_40_6]